MSFRVTADEPTLIYGGGIFGVGCAARLLSRGFNVVGIIDIDPGKVKDAPVPVYIPEEAATKFPEAFIWVCLANGLPHMEIGRTLSSIGLEHILFLPLYLDNAAAREMMKAYNAFCIGNYAVDIPCYSSLWKVCAEEYMLDENSGFVIARIHKNHIFTTEVAFKGPIDNPYSLHKTLNNPYDCRAPYVPYVPLQELNDFYAERFQTVRGELFRFFENSFYTNPEFFAACPCACTLSENSSKWYILDGNHRAAYLMIKGVTAIPVRARYDEYLLYFHEAEAQALMNYCKELPALPCPVEHPAFLRFPVNETMADREFSRLYSSLWAKN